MRRLARGVLWIGLAVTLAGLAAGFLGAVHPAGDSLAVLRLHLGALAMALALCLVASARRGRRTALAGLALGAAMVLPAAVSYLGGSATAAMPGGRGVYQKNLRFDGADLAAVAADIRASGADIVTLQEVSRRNRAILGMLRADYPSQQICDYSGVGGPAVLSRWPIAEAPPLCAGWGGLAALPLVTPEGPVWAVSLHLHWPWPYRQPAQVADILPVLGAMGEPVIVAGDFNMVPWGASVRSIARAARAERAGATVTTFPLRGGFPRLPIDHVLLPRGWSGSLEVRPELGSDHRGLLVRYGP